MSVRLTMLYRMTTVTIMNDGHRAGRDLFYASVCNDENLSTVSLPCT